MKTTVETFARAKAEGRKLVMVTAYDYAMAKIADAGGVDAILVGDSLGMVMLGYENTLAVTVEDMIHHTRAVTRGAKDALVIGDLPFMSYHVSVSEAVRNAGRLIKEGGAQAVKLEGGSVVCPQIRAIVEASIPVVAHIGLTPQSINMLGGFKVQGKDTGAIRKILDDAKAVEAAGAFAVVVECVPEKVAARITDSLSIPTIGIGAGKSCDGQVLVCHDLLGMSGEFAPKFVKRYEDVGARMQRAFAAYAADVRAGTFPGPEHAFAVSDEVLNKLY